MIYLRKKCFLSNARFHISLGKEGMIVYDWNFTWNVVSNWMMINQNSNVSCNKLLNFWNAKNTYISNSSLKISLSILQVSIFSKIHFRDVYLITFCSIFDVNYMIFRVTWEEMWDLHIRALIEKLHKNDMLHDIVFVCTCVWRWPGLRIMRFSILICGFHS